MRPRAGLGPAPTDIPERSRFFVGAAHWAARPNRLPFPGGPASVRPLRHTRNCFLFCRGESQTRPPFWEICRGAQCAPAGRPGTGPYRYSGTLPFLRRGGYQPPESLPPPRGKVARPKVVTDEGALVARTPRSSHGQLPAATQGRHSGPPLLAHKQNED